jgi:predicted nucleic acid-binding protein
MNRFVIDNSVVLCWCLEDEGCRYADALLEQIPQCEALVPAIWPLELTNALLMAERRKRITEAELTRSLSILKNFPIQVEQEPPERAWTEVLSLARSQGLTTYDASYLDLAMRTGLPIATLDKALRKAARKAQVSVYKP